MLQRNWKKAKIFPVWAGLIRIQIELWLKWIEEYNIQEYSWWINRKYTSQMIDRKKIKVNSKYFITKIYLITR